MRSCSMALQLLSTALGSYLGGGVIAIVQVCGAPQTSKPGTQGDQSEGRPEPRAPGAREARGQGSSRFAPGIKHERGVGWAAQGRANARAKSGVLPRGRRHRYRAGVQGTLNPETLGPGKQSGREA